MPHLDFMIQNDGPDIASTDFFRSGMAGLGLFILSWHAGVLRILVPDNQSHLLPDMQTALMAVVTSGLLVTGEEGIEVMFDDGSPEPFAITLGLNQCDHTAFPRDESFIVSAWTSRGRCSSWPGRFRTTTRLPCLAPWSPGRS